MLLKLGRHILLAISLIHISDYETMTRVYHWHREISFNILSWDTEFAHNFRDHVCTADDY